MRKRVGVLILLSSLFFSAQAQFKNIKLTDLKSGVYPATGSDIAINQKNPNNIIAGVSPNLVFYSLDEGKTWIESQLTSPNGVAGNPYLVSDLKGHTYYFHRSDQGSQGKDSEGWLDRITFHKTTDDGKTWTEGESIGLNASKDQDRPRASTHPRKSDLYLTWTQFDKYGSADTTCHSTILFSMSGGGKKWSKPAVLSRNGDCIDDDNTPAGASTVVDMDGRVLATWSSRGTIYFDRSFDGGTTWLSNDIALAKQPGGWSFNIPGVGKTNGKPMMALDNSTSAYHNLIYVMWADQRNGEDDTDIWIMRSSNRGDNWTEPLKVNQDSSKHHQFMPAMSVDQTTGFVYIMYYDRRDHDDNNQTDVYMSYSMDGGNHFTDVKINENSFLPVEGKFLSDYNSISAHKGLIAPIWTSMDGETNSVWTSVIKQAELSAAPVPKPKSPVKKPK